MAKVALAMIVKDDSEKKMLYRCLSSIAKHVDGIYVTITNEPCEELKFLLENFGAHVSYYKWDKSFSRARNYNLAQIPDDYDYVLWTDADDVWQNADRIPDMVHTMDKNNLSAIFLEYNYMIDESSGEIMIHHPRERLIRKGFYEWKGNLHETLIPLDGVTPKIFSTKDVWVDHLPEKMDDENKLYRNLEILEAAYQDEGDNHDPRTEFYLARNYFDVQEDELAEKLFADYIQHSGWDEERAQACNYLGLIALRRKEYDEAIIHFLEATRQKAILPEMYVNLAYTYSLKEDWENTEHWLRVYSVVPEPKAAAIRVPIDNKIKYNETYFRLAIKKGDTVEAAKALAELMRIDSGNEIHKKRAHGLVRMNDWVEATKGVQSIIKELKEIGEENQIEILLNSLPSSISDNAYIAKLRNEFGKPVVWAEKSICYFTGQTFEEWSPKSLETGIGGSETAVIQLSQEWVKLGYKVVVYGRFGSDEGTFNGVEYRNYYRFNREDTFDTLIIWRNPALLDIPLKARRIYLDLHDVPQVPDYTAERTQVVDKVFLKSEYHKSLLRMFNKGVIAKFPEEKLVVIPNGFDAKYLAQIMAFDPNNKKLVYSSSYDRGLFFMLKFGWPIIKKAVPDAELHIYYGWKLFDLFYKNNPTQVKWKETIIELMKQPGVFEHGRVGQDFLLKQKAQSAIHYYGATFEEIDCISVRESAAVGCVPCTTDYAALSKRAYCETVEGDPLEQETHELLANRIVTLLNNPKELETIRNKFMESAQKEDWTYISQAWSSYFE